LASRRLLIVWLLCALVGAQALGFMHRVVHAPAGGAASFDVRGALDAAGAPQDVHAHDGHAAGSWLDGLFGHDQGVECRLFDGVAQDGPLLPPACAAPVILPAAQFLSFLAGEFIARRAALFEARAPPLSR
jgi:hypothetical protein